MAAGLTSAAVAGPEQEVVWRATAGDWADVAQAPSGWSYTGEAPLSLDVSAEGEPVLVLSNMRGSLSSLDIPMPPPHRYADYDIVLRLGTKPGEGGGNLNWFLKKSSWELRASNTEIFLYNASTRERVVVGEFRPGVVQEIRMVYSAEDQEIREVLVDGKAADGFVSYPTPSLASGGSMTLHAPTASEGVILFGGLEVHTDAGALAELPRWRQPVRAEEDAGLPPVIPSWEPVPHAAELVFMIDPERLSSPAFDRGILFSLEDFARLEQALADDPAMRRFWEGLEDSARGLLKAGRPSLPEDEAARLTYVIRFIAPLGLLYAATGEEHLGGMLRGVILDLAERPMSFWIHSDLRRYDPDWPTGQLETAELARTLALAAHWAQDLFTAEEYATVMGALQQKGLDPSLRWIEGRGMVQTNNYLSVIGGGALIAAIVLEDAEAEVLSVAALERWLALVEEDGSYGEPQGYFEYGCSRFFYGWWALGHERAKAMLQNSSMRYSLDWMVSYFILAEHEGTTSAWRVNFGDDDFLTGPHGRTTFTYIVSESLAYAYDDGLGTWISEHLIHPDSRLSLFDFTFKLSKPAALLPEPVSPEEKDLPLARSFDNGVVVIRSSWDFKDATVFALRSGGANRTGYAHDRPNRNAFVLFAHGDYLAIAPGRSSYRSPLFRGWDIPTTTHNTIALDGGNQTRDRHAEVVLFEDTDDYALVVSEAAGAYEGSPESVLRRVWYLKDINVFVIDDEVLSPEPRLPGWHLLLSNFRDESELLAMDDGGWKLQRGGANLSFYVQADEPLLLSERSGYMHSGYSYYPGDPFEGPEGSAFSMTWQPEAPVSAIHYQALLLPNAGSYSPVVHVLSDIPEAPAWVIELPDRQVMVALEPDGESGRRLVLEGVQEGVQE